MMVVKDDENDEDEAMARKWTELCLSSRKDK
jgi:hypothetical protein